LAILPESWSVRKISNKNSKPWITLFRLARN
jgi:hypothetical protein